MSRRLVFTFSREDYGKAFRVITHYRYPLLAHQQERLWLRRLLPPGGGVLDEKDPERDVDTR